MLTNCLVMFLDVKCVLDLQPYAQIKDMSLLRISYVVAVTPLATCCLALLVANTFLVSLIANA